MKTRNSIILILLVLLTCVLPVDAQTPEYKAIHQGNRAFVRKDYKQAEHYYRIALKANPSDSRAHFNLGDAFLAQNNPKSAMQEYEAASRTERNKAIKAMAFHNMGYIHQSSKQYDQAIDMYKKALRLNPYDDDTRYNLALCQKQKKNQNDDKQQQQKQQQQQQKQEQQEQQEQQQQQNKPDEQKISNDNAEQLLNLSRQSERQTQEKVQRAQQPRRKTLEKNW